MNDDSQGPRTRGYWTAKELAEAAGVSDARIRQLLLAGILTGDKVGLNWTIPYQVGQRWLTRRMQET
jgi:hypothetical protein